MKLPFIILLLCLLQQVVAQNDTTIQTATIPKDSLILIAKKDSLNSLFPDSGSVSIGIASFYHQKFNGRKTSSGEIFSNDNLTAAHKTLKLGTYVKVRCLKNDSIVIVKVNDRLPPNSKRSIDLTTRAAKQLNFIQSGLTKVEITVLSSKPEISQNKKHEKHPHKKRNHRKRK